MAEIFDWEKETTLKRVPTPKRSRKYIILRDILDITRIAIWYAFLLSAVLYFWGVIP